ncbi:MAG: hypothetical protein ACK56F_17380 [bacterium]
MSGGRVACILRLARQGRGNNETCNAAEIGIWKRPRYNSITYLRLQ